MKRFSIGYNHDPAGFRRVLERYHDHVYEVFLPCDPALASTARPFPDGYSPGDVEEIIACAHRLGMQVNLLLNGEWTPVELYDEQFLAGQIDGLRRLVRLGVESVTVRNTHLLARGVYGDALGVRVENTVNLHLDSLEGALFAVRHLHLDTVVWDRPLNRDLYGLKRAVGLLRREHPEVRHKILLNEGCLYRCPFKTDHDSLVARRAYAGEEHLRALEAVEARVGGQVLERALAQFTQRCARLVRDDPALFLKMPIVYPRQVAEYAFVDGWKLDTRARSSESITALLEAYVTGADEAVYRSFWDDSLAAALCAGVPDAYYRRTLTCRHACSGCGLCDEIGARISTSEAALPSAEAEARNR